MYRNIYDHILYICNDRTKLYYWVCLKGLQEVGEGNKMLENEKHWNNTCIYEYNIMPSTVSCWILGELGDRESVRMEGRGLIW
jgi:hypothetical protein